MTKLLRIDKLRATRQTIDYRTDLHSDIFRHFNVLYPSEIDNVSRIARQIRNVGLPLILFEVK